jgi:large subunit ribosomal protein L9
MRVILLRSVDRLGAVGDTVVVTDGYARNWLLPQGYGLEATPANIGELNVRKRKILAQEADSFQKLQALAAEVAKQSVTIMARANEEDKLFGSVTPRDIARAFEQETLAVEPRWILMDEPIRELGCFTVRVRLHPEIEVATKVWVVRADEGEAAIKESGAETPEPAEMESPDADEQKS